MKKMKETPINDFYADNQAIKQAIKQAHEFGLTQSGQKLGEP